jgi:hypothetical protein
VACKPCFAFAPPTDAGVATRLILNMRKGTRPPLCFESQPRIFSTPHAVIFTYTPMCYWSGNASPQLPKTRLATFFNVNATYSNVTHQGLDSSIVESPPTKASPTQRRGSRRGSSRVPPLSDSRSTHLAGPSLVPIRQLSHTVIRGRYARQGYSLPREPETWPKTHTH